MSLNFSVTKIANYKQNFPDAGNPDNPQWNAVTHALVFLAIPCGFQAITDMNYRDVFKRINAYESVAGAMLSGPKGDVLISLENVRLHIGLTTNCSNTTESVFRKVIFDSVMRDAKLQLEIQDRMALDDFAANSSIKS